MGVGTAPGSVCAGTASEVVVPVSAGGAVVVSVGVVPVSVGVAGVPTSAGGVPVSVGVVGGVAAASAGAPGVGVVSAGAELVAGVFAATASANSCDFACNADCKARNAVVSPDVLEMICVNLSDKPDTNVFAESATVFDCSTCRCRSAIAASRSSTALVIAVLPVCRRSTAARISSNLATSSGGGVTVKFTAQPPAVVMPRGYPARSTGRGKRHGCP